MGWFGKDAEPKKEASARVYKFEDFLDAAPGPPKELPADGPRLDVLEREVKRLREQVLDYKVRIAGLEASMLAHEKAVNDWFRDSACATFCELRDAHIKDLRKEVVVTSIVKEHIREAVEKVAKDVFSTNEASAFAKELGKAVIAAVGRKLGQRGW